ncbi:ABC-three component system protein [Aquimarina sp. Aq107]|uniref:ABC-three component system protein n=1 Tax=Aquimarina sp. Aq107 TaxID=1191912 RepID=UPI000D551D4D|nr:ABC-three component system protein [Aquimarina sp. Aq107]
MTNTDLEEVEAPKSFGTLTNSEMLTGIPIPPIDRLKIISSEEFEDLIREWIAGYCKKKYKSVLKTGGANDKGRDVVGFINEEKTVYDNFQCKHYDHPLMPSDIWSELIKLCCYSKNGDYSLPRKYYFVAPQGVGGTLAGYLGSPTMFKTKLYENWDSHKNIGVINSELTEELKAYIETINFDIFTFLDPQELIEQHKTTNYYTARFGGGLLNRRNEPDFSTYTDSEYSLRFIEQLFLAYSDCLKKEIKSIEELKNSSTHFQHFGRQRSSFYWAESLNQFSRDSLPEGDRSFEDLKEEIFQGVVDICLSDYDDAYKRIVKTTLEASKMTIHSNALVSVTRVMDKIGLCHHLINEEKLSWV